MQNSLLRYLLFIGILAVVATGCIRVKIPKKGGAVSVSVPVEAVSATVSAFTTASEPLKAEDDLNVIEAHVARERYAEAISELKRQREAGKLRDKDAVLYDIQMAMLLHLNGEFEKSNRRLDQAERRMDELFTKSLTTEASSYLTNDNALPYEGEDFEKVMVNIIGALNYVFLQQWNEALVEMRKVDHKLNVYSDKYKKKASFRLTKKALRYLEPQIHSKAAFAKWEKLEDLRFPTQDDFLNAAKEATGKELREPLRSAVLNLAEESIYREDAFARYLSGILYEALGEENDAFIAYRKAYATYQSYQKDYDTPVPVRLKQDLLRVTRSLGLTAEYQEYRKAFPEITELSEKVLGTQGELVFISYNDLSPVKVQHTVRIPVPVGTRVDLMKMAFPRFAVRSNQVAYAEMILTSATGEMLSQQTFEVENIEAIAIKDLDDRIGRIRAKAIARATAKFVAVKSAEKGAKRVLGTFGGFAAGSAGSTVVNISERIDKRSWRLLPGNIHLGRFLALPGVYQLSIQYYSKDKQLLGRQDYRDIRMETGKKTFIRSRFFSDAGTN